MQGSSTQIETSEAIRYPSVRAVRALGIEERGTIQIIPTCSDPKIIWLTFAPKQGPAGLCGESSMSTSAGLRPLAREQI